MFNNYGSLAQMFSLTVILYKTLGIVIIKMCKVPLFLRSHILSRMSLLYTYMFVIMFFYTTAYCNQQINIIEM